MTNKKKPSDALMIAPSKIVVPDNFGPTDGSIVAEIAESFAIQGQLSAIWVKARGWGKYELVAGVHRLEAARNAKLKVVACRVFSGSSIEAELLKIDENLCRKKLSVLEEAELLVRRDEVTQRMGYISGQVVRKHKLGRPFGGKANRARDLPLHGMSHDARRKKLERAAIIDGIDPLAKIVIKELKLDNNQAALLRIAKEDDAEAQRLLAKAIAEGTLEVTKKSKTASGKKREELPVSVEEVAGVNDVPAGQKRRSAKAHKLNPPPGLTVHERVPSGESDDVDRTDKAEPHFDKLKQAWLAATVLRRVWADADEDDRRRFIDEVLTADNDEDEDWTDN